MFKMWVQTSMAHNMTVVDCRMQKPSFCRCIYYADHERVDGEKGFRAYGGRKEDRIERGGADIGRPQEMFSAVCAQTVTEWIDPPYGGQTPYLPIFPEEKCAREGRYILPAECGRRQGEIGEY